MEKNPWKELSVREVYENPWLKVTEYQVLNPAGKPRIYGKVHFKNRAIGVVPIDEHGYTWLVGQWRFPLNAWSWEIPEGGCPSGQEPLEAAQRELREETGLVAQEWNMIQRMHLSNSVSDEEGFIYVATGLSQLETEREETEADMRVWRLPFREAHGMVLDGKLTDSLTVIGLLRAARLFPHLLSDS